MNLKEALQSAVAPHNTMFFKSFEAIAEINNTLTILQSDNNLLESASKELINAFDDVQELESMVDVAESQLKNENYIGLETVSVRMINNKLKRMESRYGFNISEKAESFSNESLFDKNVISKRGQTKISLEGVKETLAKAWQGLKAFVKKIIDYIVSIWNKWFGKTEDVREKTKDIYDEVQETNINHLEFNLNETLSSELPLKRSSSSKEVIDLVMTHDLALGTSNKFAKMTTELVEALSDYMSGKGDHYKEMKVAGLNEPMSFGSKEKPLYEGTYIDLEYRVESATEDKEEITKARQYADDRGNYFDFDLTDMFKNLGKTVKNVKMIGYFNTKHTEIPKEPISLLIRTKEDLINILDSNLKLLDSVDKLGKDFVLSTRRLDNSVNKLKSMNQTSPSKDTVKDNREALKAIYHVISKLPKVNSDVNGLIVKLLAANNKIVSEALQTYKTQNSES